VGRFSRLCRQNRPQPAGKQARSAIDDALVGAVELQPPITGETCAGYPWDLPIVLAYPGSTILACTDEGLHETAYDDAEPVRLTRGFPESPHAFRRALLDD
jgi:hypothetical protein